MLRYCQLDYSQMLLAVHQRIICYIGMASSYLDTFCADDVYTGQCIRFWRSHLVR